MSTHSASAYQISRPSIDDVLADTVYQFNDGTSSINVKMPEGEYTWTNRPTLEVSNNTDNTLFCTYWYGDEHIIRPAYDVFLYGKASEASDHGLQVLHALNDPQRTGVGFKSYETHYGANSLHRIPLRISERSEVPLAVLSQCYSHPLDPVNSFNYTVVDQDGNELSDLIPDTAPIRAKIDKASRPAASLSSSGSS